MMDENVYESNSLISTIFNQFDQINRYNAKIRLIEEHMKCNVPSDQQNDFLTNLLVDGFKSTVMNQKSESEMELIETIEKTKKNEIKQTKVQEKINERMKLKQSERKQRMEKGNSFIKTAEGIEAYSKLKKDPIFGFNLTERSFMYGYETFKKLQNEVNFIELATKIHSERHLLVAKVLQTNIAEHFTMYLDANKKSFKDKYTLKLIRSSVMSKVSNDIKEQFNLKNEYSFNYAHYFRIYMNYATNEMKNSSTIDDNNDQFFRNGVQFFNQETLEIDFSKADEIVQFLLNNNFINTIKSSK